MAWPPSTSTSGFWEDDAARDVASQWEFQGPEGLRRLHGPQSITTPDPGRFSARLNRVQLDHVALEEFTASTHRVERGPTEIATYPTPLLTVIVLLGGRLDVDLSDTRFAVSTGQSVVIDSRQPIAITAPENVHMVRSVVGLEHIPEALQRQGATVPGALPATPLVRSFTAFAGTILQSTEDGRRPQGPELIAAMAQLQSAVLAEAQRIAEYPVGPAGLRYRIEELIEARHQDPAFDPSAISTALGVSLRHVHSVFDRSDRTIARVIRDRRAASAADRLRAAGSAGSLAELARRSGFGSIAALNHSFQQRYGMTCSEYRDGGHRTIG